MGLSDREYYRTKDSGSGSRRRRSGRAGLIPFNTWLIVANVAVFLLQGVLARTFHSPYGPQDPIHHFGHFSTFEGFLRLEVWRLVTFQFIHANLIHLAFNMFGLWVFGPLVEDRLGFRRYAAFYIVCGVFGGVAYLVLNFLGHYLGVRIPGALFDDPRMPLIGASAGVFGVIMASAKLAPNEVMQLLFPPVPIRLKYFAYGYAALAAINLLVGGKNAGGDAAHLGGAIAGFFFIRNLHLLRDFFDVTSDSRPDGRSRRSSRFERRVDRVLEKVRHQPLSSLTPRERDLLRRASDRSRAG